MDKIALRIVIKDFFESALCGFARMAKWLGVILLAGSGIVGVVSATLLLCQEINFQWWFIPFWVIDLFIVAACIGEEWPD